MNADEFQKRYEALLRKKLQVEESVRNLKESIADTKCFIDPVTHKGWRLMLKNKQAMLGEIALELGIMKRRHVNASRKEIAEAFMELCRARLPNETFYNILHDALDITNGKCAPL